MILDNLQIQYVPTESLRPYTRNARTHKPPQIKQIARSIQAFGNVSPILARPDGTIIAGHARLEAAKRAGHKLVPVIYLPHLSEAQQKALRLADNKLAQNAGWDPDLLVAELAALAAVEFPLDQTGFEIGEVDSLFEAVDEKSGKRAGKADRLPTFHLPVVSRLGDLWQAGDHRIGCGDARDRAIYQALLGQEQATVVVTDPPYNVRVGGHVCGLGAIQHPEFMMASGEMTEPQFTEFLTDAAEAMAVHCRDGAILFMFMDWRHMGEMLVAGGRAGLELKNLCIWNKDNGGMGTFYRSKHEMVFVWKHGTAPHLNTFELGQHGRYRTNVWDYSGVNTMRPGRMDELSMHPTVKPVALVADAIKDVSARRDIVLDPFSGSGTTMIAAEQTGRWARVIELDPQYVDVALRRWQAYTGKQAILMATGRTFDEVEDERRALNDDLIAAEEVA
jgi:DNA modification methylase